MSYRPKPWSGMPVFLIPIERVAPYARNSKTHPDSQIADIMASLLGFGWTRPILVDDVAKVSTILAGHGTVKAASRIWEAGDDIRSAFDGAPIPRGHVPCISARNLSDTQRRAYVIADNRLAQTPFDTEMLTEEIKALMALDFDLRLTGFDQAEIDEIVEGLNIDLTVQGQTDPNAVPDVASSAVSKPGDLWLLGSHRLLCGDATSDTDVKRLVDGQRVNMVLTDPPYGMRLESDFSSMGGSAVRRVPYRYRARPKGRKEGGCFESPRGKTYAPVRGDGEDFKPELISTIFESFKKVAEIFVFGADYFAELIPARNDGSWLVWDKRKESQAEAIGSEFELCWSKARHKRRMLRHDWFGFLSSGNAADARNRVHPTQKPITLLIDIMQQWGSNGDKVADLYGGSGSLIIACEKTARTCLMMEIEPLYVDVIVKRWEKFTGKSATLTPGGVSFAQTAKDKGIKG